MVFIGGNADGHASKVLDQSKPIRLSMIELFYQSDAGVKILEEDWDNLIILDACRYDYFKRANYLPGNLSSKTSLGSATAEFIKKNFAGIQAHDTIYITTNPVIGSLKEVIDVFKLIGLWDGNPQNGRISRTTTADPDAVVEKTLEAYEMHPEKKIISHFLPPHTPYIVKDGAQLPPESPYRTFEALREGKITSDQIQDVYNENLEYILTFVEELINRLDGLTVVTADHGELLGEGVPLLMSLLHPRWGLGQLDNFDYGHYRYIHEPQLIRVPWLVIDGDRRSISDDKPVGHTLEEASIRDHLMALGYR